MSPTVVSPRPVPLFELATQYQQIRAEVEAAVREVLDSQQFTSGATSGPFVGRFEEHLGAKLGAKVVALSSGTDAILAALMAIGIRAGDEVITTPFTFFATAGCISRLGAKPVFVDIDPQTFLLDTAKIPAAITPRTRAIIPVHLYGQMGDAGALWALARQHGLAVIEDACQAMGASDPHGVGIAGQATAACLSFYPTKTLGAAGDAGALVTRDPTLAQKYFQLRQHGEVSRYHHEFVGGNFRMDAIQAAVLDVKLRYLDRWTAQRQAVAAYYTQGLAGISGVLPPYVLPGANHVYALYVLRVVEHGGGGKVREALREHLTKQGIGCGVYYPKCLHEQQCFADLGYKKGAFPRAERATEEVLALPMFPEMSEGQMERVVTGVRSFFK